MIRIFRNQKNNKMRLVYMPFFLLLFFSYSVSAETTSEGLASEIEQIPPCVDVSCDRVAKMVPWKHADKSAKGQKVRLGRFSFVIPHGAEVRLSGDTTFFHYSDSPRRMLSFRLNTISDIDRRESELGDMHFSDSVNILFTKTRKDKEPTNADARSIWRSLMHAKSVNIPFPERTYYSSNGKSEVAFGKWEDERHFIFVANQHTTFGYVQIETTGFSDAEMKAIAFQN